METKKCSVPGCDRVVLAKELCATHYQQIRRNGTLREEKFCSVCGCTAKHYAKGLCERHYFNKVGYPRRKERKNNVL